MSVFYIDVARKNMNTAGTKAPDDIAHICKDNNYNRFDVPAFPDNKNILYQKIWLMIICTRWWLKLAKRVHTGDAIIMQHPMYGKRIAAKMIKVIKKNKNCKFIAVIHDLESLRGGIQGVIKKNTKTNEFGDTKLLINFDIVICHNANMKRYLITNGLKPDNLVCLDIFDYLGTFDSIQHSRSFRPSIAIAGNLALGKCGYIYDILGANENKNRNLIIHLYGNNYDMSRTQKNMVYHGSFKPEELPEHLEGDFGLVWDGISAATCEGNTGQYLKYNNPHKASLYLASGLPIIVWKQAAIADFVLNNAVGIAVDNLFNLDKLIAEISDADHQLMCQNALKIGKQIKSGYYFNKALDKAFEKICI